MLPTLLIILSSIVPFAQASITVYNQVAFGHSASPTNSAAPTATLPAAYNYTKLVPPPIPNPAPPNAFTLTLQQDAAAVNGLSIPHVGGAFWGFSIEMSVIGQVRE